MRPTAEWLTSAGLRHLGEGDFEAVVDLDRRITGHSRRGYFEKRLAAALRHPLNHIQLAAGKSASLDGFVMARVVGGEYGRPEPAAVLEAIGVEPDQQGKGVGRSLLSGLSGVLARREIPEIMTQARWTNAPLLRFLAGIGFVVAPRHVLHCKTARVRDMEREEAQLHEIADDFKGPGEDPELDGTAAGSGAPLNRALNSEDGVVIARIDRKITGEDRRGFLDAVVDQALNDSAIRVSLVAEIDDCVVAFAMARVDFGDYGQTEPVAALDLIGVDPAFEGQGLGRGLLLQLLTNLSALRVERVETQVGWDRLALLGFLFRCGFGPSQVLAFSKRLN